MLQSSHRARLVMLLLGFVALAAPPAAAQVCDLGANGTFAFLNEAFPEGSTTTEYLARLTVVNADGPVTFSVGAGGDPLQTGLTLDPQSGFVTGLSTESKNIIVEFQADDGTQQITKLVEIKINSSGTSGGAQISNNALADARVGQIFAQMLVVTSGTGPFTFGGSDLPPGLSLNGSTGEISGTPSAAGTYFVNLTAHDKGQGKIAQTVLPLRVFPTDPASTLAFTTQFLNNGEVGTPFCDAWQVEGAAGPVTFGVSGLPDGLALDPLTGVVDGTPMTAGHFAVTISANDGTASIRTNLAMHIAWDSTSSFHWNYFGLPAALEGEVYDNQPPIVLAADAGMAVAYTAVGLPPGISYDVGSGELQGTATEMGEYAVTFIATDGPEVLVLEAFFIVLPASGGDVAQIPVNFWVSKSKVSSGEAGRDSWQVVAIYNADRRSGQRFDPSSESLLAALGSRVIEVEPGEFVGDDARMSFTSPSGDLPAESVRLDAGRQRLSWKTKADTINEGVPGVLSQVVTLGGRSYRLLLSADRKGGVKRATAYERTAFVVDKGALQLKGAGLDSAKLGLLLADPNASYEAGVSTLRVRILDGATVLVDRDFTVLGGPAKLRVDPGSGRPTFAFKTLRDTEPLNQVKLAYASSAGKMKLALSALDLSGITPGEAHLTVELTIGDRVYSTRVTFFEMKPGRYGLMLR